VGGAEEEGAEKCYSLKHDLLRLVFDTLAICRNTILIRYRYEVNLPCWCLWTMFVFMVDDLMIVWDAVGCLTERVGGRTKHAPLFIRSQPL